ncbi:hypothetical protein Dvina_19545 [Dactylosporangium vinaceum]|uniref:DUF2254 domain-containing protein n=1 Tax=Dactylosporangium vinaceum TaxID=53362 RepID=A0ABV5M9Q2_9ACTN|nr:hypothetical protein [Dactylosporangium vinaceum]UAC00056.1 hypothetical protein Dvina_19545 [Dactylosporangium vinaceum]
MTAPFRRAAGGAGATVQWLMWGVAAVAAVFAVVAGFDLVYLSRVEAALPEPDLDLLRAGQGLGTSELILFWGVVIVYALWFVLTSRALQRLGEDANRVLLTPWSITFQVGALATIIAARTLPGADAVNADEFGARLRWIAPILAARLGLVALLGVVLFTLYRRVYAALLRSGVAPLRDPAEQPVTLLDLLQRASVISLPAPPADDAWWSEAAGLIAASATPLNLVETLDGDIRQHQVDAGTDLAALRAALRPGARLNLAELSGEVPPAHDR